MITTAAIAWAVVATGGAVVVERLCVWQLRSSAKAMAEARETIETLERERRDAIEQGALWKEDAITFCYRAIDAEDRLRKIEQSRHNAAKHARAAQIAQQRAARDAKTAELARGVAAKVERQAA